MNAFKRAWRYITRKPTKSILLIITFFVIGNLVILGLGISQAAENAKVLTRKQMRAVVNYEVDYDSYYSYINSLTDEDEINEAYKNYPGLDNEAALKLAENEHVTAVNSLYTTTMYSKGFDNVPVGNEDSNDSSSYIIDDEGNSIEYTEPNLFVYANIYPNMIELQEGTFTVTEGRFYTQDDIDNANKVVLVTEELADQNGFRVGDTITITQAASYNMSTYTEAGLTEEDLNLQLEIIGIYNTLNDVDPSSDNYQWMSAYESPKNVILMPQSTFEEYYKGMMAKYYVYLAEQYPEDADFYNADEISLSASKVTYLLDDPLYVDSFVEENQSILGEYTKLDANNETFNKLARPLDTMSFFANIVVGIVIVNAVVIISLVTALTLKTREYEIGVLLSIGVSKFKVIVQLFVELIIIAMVGFLFAVGTGSLIAGKVGDAVLEYQTNTEAQYSDDTDNSYNYVWIGDTDYFTDVSQEELLSQYHVSVGAGLIAEIYAIGTVVVLVAILVPSVMIMRLNPKQILLETN